MAKTKAQKQAALKSGDDELKKSSTLIFTDFSGLAVNDLNSLRRSLREFGGIFQVIKKRLFKIILAEKNIPFDPKNFEGQLGVVFSSRDIIETAGAVYKFAKQNDKFKILAGFDLKENKITEAGDIKKIGQLPGREVLLAQLVYMLSLPIRQFMFVLNAKAKRVEK